RTGDTLGRQMLHERDEERQILRLYPLLVERQDEGAALGTQEEIRVLDTLGDALARDDVAAIVFSDEGGELLVPDVGVDGHGRLTYAEGAMWSFVERTIAMSRLLLGPNPCAPRRRRLEFARVRRGTGESGPDVSPATLDKEEGSWRSRFRHRKHLTASLSRRGEREGGAAAGASENQPRRGAPTQ